MPTQVGIYDDEDLGNEKGEKDELKCNLTMIEPRCARDIVFPPLLIFFNQESNHKLVTVNTHTYRQPMRLEIASQFEFFFSLHFSLLYQQTSPT